MTPRQPIAQVAADAFNRHGKFTARVAENQLAVEVRYADNGARAAFLWIPYEGSDWTWTIRNGNTPRTLRADAPIADVVRAVATSVLDEVHP